MMRLRRMTFAAALLIAAGPVAGADVKNLITECESCHGPQGVSDQPDIPSLAGKQTGAIEEALDAFYYYERHCTTTTYRHGDRPKTPLSMCNVANTLSAEDKKAIADYFSQ
ncbi:MAG: hypothetical protein PVG42_02350 [Lysobacterales bacterium]